MAKLGDRVTFAAPTLHHTETLKDGQVIAGSIYCVDQFEFAAIIGRIYDGPIESGEPIKGEVGTPLISVQYADLFLLVPGKLGQWIKGIREGTKPGEFRVVK